MLLILSFVSQSERKNIRRCQAQGIAAARAKGVHLGRMEKKAPDNFPEIVTAWEEPKTTLGDQWSAASWEINVLKKDEGVQASAESKIASGKEYLSEKAKCYMKAFPKQKEK